MTATSTALIRDEQRSMMRRFADAWRKWREAREQRRAVSDLQHLDSRTLKDIGINRSEIYSIVHGDPKGRARRRSRSKGA